MSARKVAICNQKGGTGKTTTAINLSAALAFYGERVLLVDLDPQANATSGIGVDKNKIQQSIYNVLIDEEPIANALISNLLDTEMSNLRDAEMSNLLKRNSKMSNLPDTVMSKLPEFNLKISKLPGAVMSNLPDAEVSKLPGAVMSNLLRPNLVMSNLSGRLDILPSSVDLTGAEIELVSVMSREYRLKKALETVKNEYDFIIIDSPPSLGLLTINALTAADSVLIPVQCEYYALEGLSQLTDTIGLVRNNINPGLEIEGVLLTMADYRTKLTQEVISEIRTYFKDKAYVTVIPRNIRLTEAPSYGKPVIFYDKDSIGSKKYKELACEILKITLPLAESEIVRVEEQPSARKSPPAITFPAEQSEAGSRFPPSRDSA